MLIKMWYMMLCWLVRLVIFQKSLLPPSSGSMQSKTLIFLEMQASSSAMLITIHQSTWCYIPEHLNLVTCVTSALQNTAEIHDNRLHHSVHKIEILPKVWNCPHLVFLYQHVKKMWVQQKRNWGQLTRFLEILNLHT